MRVELETFDQVLEKTQKQAEEDWKKLEENGGLCLKCEKNLADKESRLCPFHCVECNKEAEDLIKQLQGPGFFQIQI